MDGLIADDGKLVRARRDEDQHSVPFARLVHSHPVELFLRRGQRLCPADPAETQDPPARASDRPALGLPRQTFARGARTRHDPPVRCALVLSVVATSVTTATVAVRARHRNLGCPF